jgi:hypothetical protein
MPLLILVPLLTFVALAITTALWIYGSLWIFTAGDPIEDKDTKFVKYTPDTFLWWMRWSVNNKSSSLPAATGTTSSGSSGSPSSASPASTSSLPAAWPAGTFRSEFLASSLPPLFANNILFLHRDKDSIGLSFGLPTMLAAFYRLLRFHLGTAAFGSFIIAIIQLLRIILKYIEHNIKDWEKRGFKGPILWAFKAFLKCAHCLLWCFEKCMKFININAYIETGDQKSF